MASDFEKGKHSQQNSIPIRELAEELPFTVTDRHKQERDNLSVPKVVVSSACPVPDVTPDESVQQEECLFGAGVFVVVCPSGNDTVQISD